MKIICIDTSAPMHTSYEGSFMPKEGYTYTAMDTVNWFGEFWYILKEADSDWGWNIKYFIPVSEIDETESIYSDLIYQL